MNTRRLALCLAILAVGPALGQAPTDVIREGAESQDAHDQIINGTAATFEFWYRFSVVGDQDLYAKSRFAGPHVSNGTAGADGWYFSFGLNGPGIDSETESVTDDQPLELGSAAANTTYRFRVLVHVPAEAQQTLGTYEMSFVLAAHAGVGGSGSGSSEDPSIILAATLNIVEPPPPPPAEVNETAPNGTDGAGGAGDNGTVDGEADVDNGAGEPSLLDRVNDSGLMPIVAIGLAAFVLGAGVFYGAGRKRAKKTEARLKAMERALKRRK